MTYRRERGIREVYEERFLPERPGPYPRVAGGVERRGPFSRPEDEYGRGGYEYEGGPRFYPNGGGPRGYHDDQRGYQVEGHHFPERRAIPPARREDFPYRVPREDPHAGRPLEFGARVPPPPSVRSQGVYPAPRSLPESGEDTLVQAIRNLDRGEDRDPYRRKAALFPPLRERSPVRREVARSPHSRSGSSVSSRSYSPDRAKTLPFPAQQGKNLDAPEGHAGVSEHLWGALFPQSGHEPLGYEETYSQCKIIDKIPGLSREGSPQSGTSNKEESNPPEAEKEDPVVAPVIEEAKKSAENIEERRLMAISAKAKEIEKVYRQDCETFGMVVKMLVAKDPSLEKQLQVPLRENLGEIRERCLEDLKHFIKELDEEVRLPDSTVCDSATAAVAQKLLKTAVNHSSSF
ncbi:periphilin-1 isoform X1 [Fundulus heteroclitus]|uniref:periphilin-1 isoform X1 n=1 Tax=Fundulus heteroclitus TaxID=8078 RepID=UPI00165A4C75|nr:periphilin-1 isoform X1 [Fundulus heteroclitus]XP_021166706.2 periphilin-1 isoform X1 [Fundulus heteroclitus]XP_036004803.1 periphilin-1 isoform X1 [Fundulus heteroclitus]